MTQKIDTSLLYVEDDKISREFANKIFGFLIRDFDIAENGKDAIAKVLNDNFLPKYIITDLKMPDMNGLDLIESVKKIKDYNPIFIMVTGYSEIDKLDNFLHGDVEKIFQKPLDYKEVLAFIKEKEEEKV